MDAQKVSRGIVPCSLGGPRHVDTVRWPIQIEQAGEKWKYPQLASLTSTFIWKNALQGHFPIWLASLGFQPHLANLLALTTVSLTSGTSYK